MRGLALRTLCGLGFLLCCGLVGCLTPQPVGPFQPDPPNPFLETLFKQPPLVVMQEGKIIKTNPPLLNPDPVLQEIPLQTPLAEARALMERHGFSCQANVQDNFRTCLYCRAYRRKSSFEADRIVVKVFYEDKRVINVEVTVEYGIKRGTGLFPEF